MHPALLCKAESSDKVYNDMLLEYIIIIKVIVNNTVNHNKTLGYR